MMKKIIGPAFLLLFCITQTAAQFRTKNIAAERLLENVNSWNEGSVLLNDGTELSGLLRFDDNTGVLSYQNGDVSKSLIARSCAGFEFYDEVQQKQRVFYVFEYEDKVNPKKHYFFEVLKEFKTFAVLSKIDPLEIEQKSTTSGNAYNPGYTSYQSTVVKQTETIFFMDPDGTIKPYLRILERENDGGWLYPTSTKTKNKFINEEVFEEYTASHYEQLEAFANKNDLSFKRKHDIMKILNEYEQLLKN